MEAVRLNVTDLSAVGTEFTVRADYETAGERYETTRAIRGAFVPGRIDLTGIDVAQIGDGAVRITGTASNVGTTRVEAVTVRVVSTARVTPSNPGKEYFVGAIAASDFSSFSVNARVEGGNETTIPLEVSYLVDGERRNRTITATYDRIETPDRGGSGFPLVGLAVVLVVGVAGLVLWRRRRAD
jgi:LPXTG-motif cell wall-anchored protein